MPTTTSTRLEYRIIRTDYYIEPYQEEPGSITFCDSGPSYSTTLTSGTTSRSLDQLKQMTAADFDIYKYDDEQDIDRSGNYDGSLYSLQAKIDGKWINVRALTPEPYPEPTEEPCIDCGRWFEVKLLNDERLCTDCKAIRIEDAKPRCVDCNTVVVKNSGDLCPACQEYWCEYESQPRCFSCGEVHTDPTLSDGDICRECDDYWHDKYKPYYRWYRRLWRWIMKPS